MKKILVGTVGALVVIGVVSGGLINELIDWSTVEKSAANLLNIILVLGGAYFVCWSFRKEVPSQADTQQDK